MDEGIVLDRKSFEALAVETRVRILKSLRERRKTLSELAGELKLSVSGVKEHLQVLEDAELVRKMDDGHKWKYYELTKKGGDVVAPRELRVWILLSISTVALIMSAMAMLYAMQPAVPASQAEDVMMPGAAPGPLLNAAGAQADANATPRAMAAPAQEAAARPWPDWVPAAVAGISALTLAGCMAVLWRNRARRS